MMESETRKELKILLENSSEKIKVFNFLTKYGFFIHHPSRFINSFYFDNNFIDHKLRFLGMADVVRATMEELSSKNELSYEVELDAVMEIDMRARSVAKMFVDKF